MHKTKIMVLALVLSLPFLGAAESADIPELTGVTTNRFIAAWITIDGDPYAAGQAKFGSLFQSASARIMENQVTAVAPFAYNVTNMRLYVSAVNCGDLGAGETFFARLRVNGLNTPLELSCNGGDAAGTVYLNPGVVDIQTEDVLTVGFTMIGNLLPRNPSASVTIEGYRNQTLTTLPVADMTNEILEAIETFLPLALFGILVVWAETSREWLVYFLATMAGVVAVLGTWTAIDASRFILVPVVLVVAARMIQVALGHQKELMEE